MPCKETNTKYSPRMWRWSQVQLNVLGSIKVFSTYVEVILQWNTSGASMRCILHVCGGDPNWHWVGLTYHRYSPRMWRWSYIIPSSPKIKWVFSTYVEVILAPLITFAVTFCILHVCGGDPCYGYRWKRQAMYSPRMWRWSLSWWFSFLSTKVFSTYVEVIPRKIRLTILIASILHVCGGDPFTIATKYRSRLYSPRMWRWS